MLFWTICCWTSWRLLEPGQHSFQGHIWWDQTPIGSTRRSWNSESNRCFMVVFQPTSGIQQHLVLLSPDLCGVMTRATTDLEVLVPGEGCPFVGPPWLLDRVSSRDSPINCEDNLSSNKDEEDPTGEVAEVCTEIPEIHGERACVSLYMPSVRLGYLPSGIYQVAVTSGPASAAPRYQAPCISERLAHPIIVRRTGQNSCRSSPAGVTTPWMGNQFQHLQECCLHFQRRLLVSDPSWRRTCQGFHGPSFSGW